MKQSLLLSVFYLALSNLCFSQIAFNRAIPISTNSQLTNEFYSVSEGDIAIGDIDNDLDNDVFIIGQKPTGKSAVLYLNDGNGNFSEKLNTPFIGVKGGKVNFFDIENDNDLDIFITGLNDSNNETSKLYINDGTGNFTIASGTPFEGMSWGSVVIFDTDGDNDLDVFLNGQGNGSVISKLYLNDGNGNFTDQINSNLIPLSSGAFEAIDIENDGDLDLVFSGVNSTAIVSGIYENDGVGSFTLIGSSPFFNVFGGSVKVFDADNDGDSDVLMTGRQNNPLPVTATLYLNDGLGNFTEAMGIPFEGVWRSSVAIDDVNGDNYSDILITGENELTQRSTKLYLNNGIGGYFESTSSSFYQLYDGAIVFGDINNDNDSDLLMVGGNLYPYITAFIYENNGAGNFLRTPNSTFYGVDNGSVDMADVDGDNDLDLLISGSDRTNLTTKLYINNGFGSYSEVTGVPFIQTERCAVKFADIDGDFDQDVTIVGGISYSPTNYIAKTYLNDGLGNFTELVTPSIIGVVDGAIEFVDVDNDNDLDLFISGLQANGIRSTVLYSNDGLGNFSIQPGNSFLGLSLNSISVGDIDNDGDVDLFITGEGDINTYNAKLYINDGSGLFTESSQSFEGFRVADTDFGDINNDGFLDLIVSGTTESNIIKTQFYINDGTGLLSLDLINTLDNITNGTANLIDLDNDLDIDLVTTGYNNGYKTKMYLNDGFGLFSDANLGPNIFGYAKSAICFSDLNGDNKIDFLVTGENQYGQPSADLYLNESTLNIINNVEASSLNIYPNPTNEWFKINNLPKEKTLSVNVTSINGTVIHDISNIAHSDKITLPQSGIYIVSVYSNDDFYGTFKVIKN